MRISDWSSDVCSSDLSQPRDRSPRNAPLSSIVELPTLLFGRNDQLTACRSRSGERQAKRMTDRSEEHTSELQSLMRISYAVFCLKKKKNTKEHKYQRHMKKLLNKTNSNTDKHTRHR